MFTQIHYPSRIDYAAICQRPALEQGQLDALISDVFSQVKSKGDQALRELTATYEKREITDILYTAAEMEDLASKTDIALQKAIDHAYANIYAFHDAQKLETNKIELKSTFKDLVYQINQNEPSEEFATKYIQEATDFFEAIEAYRAKELANG
jgi:sulfite reductase (ferredoxin)